MKYIAFYDTADFRDENRSVAPSAVNVVKYMAEVFSEVEPVIIISPSRTLNKSGRYAGRTVAVSDNISLVQPPSFGTHTPIGRILSVLYTQLWLLFYLLRSTKKHEQIAVYHSLSVILPIRIAKKIKKLRLIMEIREIYSDVIGASVGKRKKEVRWFETADSYIFPTEILNTLINKRSKPYVIAAGLYINEKRLSEKISDGRIHVVYAGTLQREKGGAIASVSAACYLDERYHIHILGFGSEEDINYVIDEIKKINTTTSAVVEYDGILLGDEFSAFLQQCHIGLSTQNPSAAFNNTSFPSKILTYIANGLDVLSADIPAVRQSPVGTCVHYYGEQSPEAIAKGIKEINVNDTVNRTDVLTKLDLKLRADISILLRK